MVRGGRAVTHLRRRASIWFTALTCVGTWLTGHAAPAPQAQQTPQRGGAPAPAGRGPTYPAQQRKLADQAVLDRGKTLFTINCAACHGADARGGDQGGPNLLRSQVVLNDQHGETILPIVRGANAQKMPPFPAIPESDVVAIAEFLHSLAAVRAGSSVPLHVLVGDASAGQATFTSMCASCHSAAGDLKGIGARIPDATALQNFWIAGGRVGGRGGGPAALHPQPTTVTVTLASGQKVEGRLARIDDFLVSLTDATGETRTFVRDGDKPKVDVHDPLEPHNQLLPKYKDRQIHDITAYLATLK